ncbi:hypothetical protein BH10BDE1_BH10BDE1_31650 [soil metagenome]
MGKKRSKTRAAVADKEGIATKARRADELRSLFDSAQPEPAADSKPGTLSGSLTKTELSNQTFHARIKNTPTPTPTVPTEVTDSHPIGKSRTNVYVPTDQTQTRAPLRTVIAENPYRPARRLDSPTRRDEKEETAWWLGPLLIVGALAMLAIGWFHIERSNMVAHPVGHPTSTLQSLTRETQDKINFYRTQLGHRLNRDRVNVEILNAQVAPALDVTATPKVDRSMLRGVPLMQENYVDQNYGGSRNHMEPVNIDHPDARIQYGLQEEQHHDEFDRRVQEQFKKDFVENARLDGVDVTLDEDGNVIRVAPIDPSSRAARRPANGYSSGAVR